MEGGNPSFPRLSQIDFDVTPVAQMRSNGPVGKHLDLCLTYLPVTLAPQDTLKFLGELWADAFATGFGGLILVAAANELDIIGKRFIRARQRCGNPEAP